MKTIRKNIDKALNIFAKGWGYKLISQNRIIDALELFKLNVSLFPSSTNAYNSLEETYLELENHDLALKNHEQTLKINPKNKNAEEMIKKLRP